MNAGLQSQNDLGHTPGPQRTWGWSQRLIIANYPISESIVLSSPRTAAKGGSTHLSMSFLSNVNLCISQPRPSSQCLKPASVSGAVIWNMGCNTISECRHTSRRWGKGGASRECWGLGTVCRDERGLKKTLVYVCWWGIAMKTMGLRQARHFRNISLSPFIRNTEHI